MAVQICGDLVLRLFHCVGQFTSARDPVGSLLEPLSFA